MTGRPSCLLLLALTVSIARGAHGQAPTANAATGYREAMSRLAVNEVEQRDLMVSVRQGRTLSTADLKLLAANREALEKMESASHISHCDFELQYVQGVAVMNFGHLAGSRTLVKLACLRTYQAIAEHDWSTAAKYLCACFRLGRHLGHDRTILSTLVQAASFRTACLCLTHVFGDHVPPAEFRSPIAEACREAHVDMSASLPYERWDVALDFKKIGQDSSERLCRGLGGAEIADLLSRGAPFSAADLKAAAEASGCPEERLKRMADPADFKAYLLEGAAELDAMMAEVCGEWARGGPDFGAHLKSLKVQFARKHPGSAKFFPTLTESWESQQQANALLARCVVLLALGDYVDREHSLPADLQELEASCGAPLPKDPLTGGNLVFQVDGMRVNLRAKIDEGQQDSDGPSTSFLFRPIGNSLTTWTVGGLWLILWGIASTTLFLSPSHGVRGNPVFARELRMRNRIRLLLRLGGAGCIGGAVVGALAPILGWSAEIWSTTFAVVLALCFFGAPPLVVACFAQERDRGTGEGVVLTSFPHRKLLLGKLAAWLLPVSAPALSFTLLCGLWLWAVAGYDLTPVGVRGWNDWVFHALVPVTVLALNVGISLRFGAPRRTLAGGLLSAAAGAGIGLAALLLPLAVVYHFGGNPMGEADAVRVCVILAVEFVAALLFAAASFRRAVLRLEETWSASA